MPFTNMLSAIAKISDVEDPSIFPFPSWMLIGIVILSVFFFSYRFAVQKRPFQLIFAIAAPISLLLLFSRNKTIFYAVGLIEFILILAAFISTFICRPKKAESTAASDKDGKNEEN